MFTALAQAPPAWVGTGGASPQWRTHKTIQATILEGREANSRTTKAAERDDQEIGDLDQKWSMMRRGTWLDIFV